MKAVGILNKFCLAILFAAMMTRTAFAETPIAAGPIPAVNNPTATASITPISPPREEKTAAEIPDPCSLSNPNILFALPDGPTVSDSPCVVPSGHVLLEIQYAHEDLRGAGGGTADVFMQATEVRFGLPGKNEFKVLTPSYTVQKAGNPANTSSGFSATGVGLKHEVGYTDKWVGSVETVLTLPSGNDAFGSHGLGAAFNGIVGYSLSDTVGLGLQLGVSTITDPVSAGGKRFTSFNPIFVTTWNPINKVQFYGEVYGQTKTASNEGAGFNFDGGVQYLIARWWEVDLAEGVRLTGNLGGFTHYLQVGTKFLF